MLLYRDTHTHTNHMSSSHPALKHTEEEEEEREKEETGGEEEEEDQGRDTGQNKRVRSFSTGPQ